MAQVDIVYREFFAAVIKVLEARWLRMVRREGMAAHIREFHAFSGFPHAIGAMDGCHIPASDYYAQRCTVVDHRYCFRYLNVGSPGRCHDAYMYGRSKFCGLVESASFQSPVSTIEGTVVPPIILCGQAFPSTSNLLKPHANARTGTREALFNYQISKTRIVVNGFGRLKARFRYTAKRMECKLRTAKQAIRAACTMHNLCEASKDPIEGQWEQELYEFNALYQQPSHATDVVTEGPEVRAALSSYFWNQSHQAQ
ncbi:uncharacterized protein LOC144116734 [Amblyomma americanum]